MCQLGPVFIDEGWTTSHTRFTESVCRCLSAGAAGLWDVIHILFALIVCVYMRAVM